MFFIPTWITNVLLLITCWLAGFQLVQLRRANPLTIIQFWMIAFSLLMMAVVSLNNRKSPWLSLVFFLIAVFNISLTIRQHRKLPPMRKFE
jgi:hypothetical protein